MRINLDRCVPWVCFGLLLLTSSDASAQLIKASKKLETDASKTYVVTKKNGPWMIMVTSLRGDTAESAANANRAAHELVMELRRKQIPAWIHEQKGELEEIASFDRNGESVKRFVASQRNRICVLAGEYSSIDPDEKDPTKAKHAKIAQDTLTWMQKYRPKALENGNFKPTPGRPGPLSRAFLTLNPMFTEEEIQQIAADKDPLLKQLNKGHDFSLLLNPNKYTLIIATFQGSTKHVLATGEKQEKEAIFKFDSMLEKNISLDRAGQSAWTLVHLLRNQGHEVYVYHERYRSVVTVGGFNDPNDPRITKFTEQWGPKMRPDPKTQQEVLTPEIRQIDGNNPQLFVMDLAPQLMKVPKFK
ncbi:MAG: hypothetical protein V4719_24000 [Planctomycetota bacterium]